MPVAVGRMRRALRRLNVAAVIIVSPWRAPASTTGPFPHPAPPDARLGG